MILLEVPSLIGVNTIYSYKMKTKLLTSAVATFLLFAILPCEKIVAQNIAINNSGTAAVASAMLDITSTSSGLLLPRMTAAQRAAIGSPATGLIVYQTDAGTLGSGFYFYNGTAWVPWGTNNGGWGLAGNTGTTAGTNYLGTTDAIDFVFRTNATERMRILSTGEVVAGSTTAFAGDVISSYGTFPLNGHSTVAGGIGVYGENSVAGAGSGVIGVTAGATGFGTYGGNVNANGTGIFGVGNNLGGTYLTNGSGGAFTGSSFGIAVFKNGALANNTGAGYFLASSSAGVGVAVAYRTGGTNYKILNLGAFGGVVSTDVWGLNGDTDRKIMFCPEAPEVFFQDHGSGKLENGKVHIELDPIFAKNIVANEKHPLRVYIQLEGDCKGVYVTNKTQTGFDVVELNGGNSNAEFSWFVNANRADYVNPVTNELISKNEDVRFPPAPNAFETKELKQVPKQNQPARK